MISIQVLTYIFLMLFFLIILYQCHQITILIVQLVFMIILFKVEMFHLFQALQLWLNNLNLIFIS
jgi:hypothetical protein